MMSVMAALCVNMLTTSMLLSIFILSDALAACPEDSALFVSTPEQMEALSGSCLQIPCNFRAKAKNAFDGRRAVVGVWIKNKSKVFINPNNVIFNSSGAGSIYPMSITGNLSQRDCTTLFANLTTRYTDTYFFRVESETFKATADCDRLQITVRDSPWRPNITIAGDLKEKESVTITCSALTPCPHSPPELTWNLQQDSHSKTQENTDGSFTTKIQQNITLSDTHDGKKISCSARYPVNQGKDAKTAETEETLSVSYPPRLISPTGPVSAGSVVNLTCSCRANPPVDSYVWFMTSGDKLETIKADTHVYSFKVTKRDRDRLFYCGCGNHLDIQISAGAQLLFEGDEHWGIMAVMKIVGIIILVSTLVIFECWFRSRRPDKPEAER